MTSRTPPARLPLAAPAGEIPGQLIAAVGCDEGDSGARWTADAGRGQRKRKHGSRQHRLGEPFRQHSGAKAGHLDP